MYKNNLAFHQRIKEYPKEKAAVLNVDKKAKELVVSTLHVEADVPVTVKDPITPSDTEEQKTMSFDLGPERSIGSFLASIVGAEVALCLIDGTKKEGVVLSVTSKKQQIGNTDGIEAV